LVLERKRSHGAASQRVSKQAPNKVKEFVFAILNTMYGSAGIGSCFAGKRNQGHSNGRGGSIKE
jgi:hypothetical protein